MQEQNKVHRAMNNEKPNDDMPGPRGLSSLAPFPGTALRRRISVVLLFFEVACFFGNVSSVYLFLKDASKGPKRGLGVLWEVLKQDRKMRHQYGSSIGHRHRGGE